jgi:hypothetical protein
MNVDDQVLNKVRHEIFYQQKLELYKNVTNQIYNRVLEQLGESYTSTIAFVSRKLYDEY